MGSVAQELARIDSLTAEAWAYVEEGDFRKARRVLRPIQNSFCVSESVQAVSYIKAEILRRTGKVDEAISAIRANLCYFWNYPPALQVLNVKNPEVDASSRIYMVEAHGSCASLGAFSNFNENYKTTFNVIANSVDEIRERVLELGIYAEPESLSIKILESKNAYPEFEGIKRGVVQTYPFEPVKRR